MESYQLVNHSFPVPRLVPDILAGALSRCLKGVVNIKLNGPIIVDAAIWDGYWPVLEFFHISLSTQTVDGGWWYDGTPPIYDISDDDDDDDDDTYWGDSVYSLDSGSSEVTDDYDVRLEKRLRGASPYPKFRTRIVPEFCGWLVAMAKGVKRMERVKKCEVVMNMFRPGSIEVYYYGEKVEGRVRRAWEVYVECEAEWKMCEELRNEWESMVGKEGVKEDSNRWQELYDLFD
jgi:hypothetical protein